MNRILIAAIFTAVTANAGPAISQTWMFQPGPYSNTNTYGPKAPDSAKSPSTYGTFTESQAAQSAQPASGPRAYATFTEAQSVEASRMPKPAFQWDPTGILGRGRQYDMWRHQEAMERARMQTYAKGVRDAVGSPLWTWNGQAPQPIPQIMAPTPTSSGKRMSQ